jgi:mono/diheme cytochrome c family protein
MTTIMLVALLASSESKAEGPPPPGGMSLPTPGPVDPGKAVFDQWCVGCHAPLAKPGGPPQGRFPPAGTYLLEQRYKGKVPSALEERTDLSPALIRIFVRRGVSIMPPTRKSEVTDKELEALIAYLTRASGADETRSKAPPAQK